MRALSTLILHLAFLPVALGVTTLALGHHVDDTNERLAKIGPAAEISLTAQDGNRFSLRQTRGKVVAISFTYTKCADTCPILTSAMVSIQNKLGNEFGTEVFFVTITMDPEADRPEVLKRYAVALGCDLRGWAFLTGTEAEIQKAAREYGVFRKKRDDGEVDHTLLTSIIDRSGTTRVQYIGNRFDPDEFLHDLRLLIDEEGPT
jgi:protein SCO1/2